MSELILVIGNKNYSSWSSRPWLAMKQAELDFQEIRVPLYAENSREELLKYSPSGKVPVLLHNDLVIWESLAICEYIAEQFEPGLWPADVSTRAIARSVSHEMHGGFFALRQNMPMNCRARHPGKGMTPELEKDIQRISDIWRACRTNYGRNGDFLFGNFSIADAMFAPVVLRFVTYGVILDDIEQEYADRIYNLPSLQEWVNEGIREPEIIAEAEL
jgi:glutathione S-transferase